MDAWFQHINIPVIICNTDHQLGVVYENKSAVRILNPMQQTAQIKTEVGLKELLQMDPGKWQEFHQLLTGSNNISAFSALLTLYSGEKSYVKLAAGRIEYEGRSYFQICMTEIQQIDDQISWTQAIENVFHLIYQARTSDDAINELLKFAGQWTDSSRSYIFESVSDTTTSNTYEWCAPGIASEIEQLRDLPKNEYSYDDIIARGLAVTDDIRKLTPEDRVILEAQGIKALAVIPIIGVEGALGYIGFDDCEKYRIWSQKEVQFLTNLAEVLASLLVRRNTERSLNYSMQVLDAVTNSQESLIMVVDARTQQILFANQAFSVLSGRSQEEIKGRLLADFLREDLGDVSYKNPLLEMVTQDGIIEKRELQWEYHATVSGKWYLVRDSIIHWIDGRDALIETATEITDQKVYEAELEYQASRDMMTDTYNREWSQKLLENILADSSFRPSNVLVFLDLDRLKQTNDKYGHAAGDEMILNIVGHIKACIRKSDVLCRWGGDEFLMILRATPEQARQVVEKILRRLDEHNSNPANRIRLSFSYGIVEIDSQIYSNVDKLVKEADERMYRNKQRLKIEN